MTERKPETRECSMELDLRHSPETVWQALTDPVELVRWFPQKASVETGVGGAYKLDWDAENCSFHTRIAIWEPPHRLRLVYDEERSVDGAGLAIDFQLQAHPSGCSLRLVHSGFGRDSDWDDEFEGVSRGWAYELKVLGHYLNRYQGQDRHLTMLFQPSNLSPRATFARLFGSKGFGDDNQLHGLAVGDSYRLNGTRIYQGQIFFSMPPIEWAGTIEGEVEGMLCYHLEPNQTIALGLATWGDNGARSREFTQFWQERLTRLFA